jgi:NAD(P)-dependent dehydrogenase (short-subunit alcohol dehydrogenase family)
MAAGPVRFVEDGAMSPDGKVALVSAAGAGIGAAAALLLARRGCAVVGVDLDGDALDRQRRALGADGVLHPVVADVGDPIQVDAAVARAVELGGRLDVLANVAGGSRPGQTVVELEPAEWDRLVRVNLTSVYLMCRAAIPHLRAAGGGTIVNVSSGAGVRGMHANPAYVAAKAGVVALTRALALDHGPEGIRPNCIAPGPVATPLMRRNRTPEEIEGITQVSITGRLGEPEELAEVIAWLAGDQSSYVMGQCIEVDGGVASMV